MKNKKHIPASNENTNILKFQLQFQNRTSLVRLALATKRLWNVLSKLCMLCLFFMRLVPESLRPSQLLIPALVGTQTLYCSLRYILLRCERRSSGTCGNIKPVSEAARRSDINLLLLDTKVKTATAPLV